MNHSTFIARMNSVMTLARQAATTNDQVFALERARDTIAATLRDLSYENEDVVRAANEAIDMAEAVLVATPITTRFERGYPGYSASVRAERVTAVAQARETVATWLAEAPRYDLEARLQ